MKLEERLRDVLTVVKGCAEFFEGRGGEERAVVRSLTRAAEDLESLLGTLTESDKNPYVSIERSSLSRVV